MSLTLLAILGRTCRLKHRKGLEELVVMGNKPPRWNDEVRASGE